MQLPLCFFVGGADSVVKMIPVDRVLQPAYEGTSAEYDDFLTAMEEALK